MAWRMIVAALLIGLSQQGAHAQYSTKPVRVVVPYPAGGAVDSFARVLTQQLSELWDQPVVVENRPGGSTTIGAEQVAKSPADGYTLMLTAKLTLVTVPHLYEKFHTTHCGILRRLQRSFPQPRLWSPILRCRLRQ
ncbi:MAG: tripartite tricarboxylate transporter substrate-binding protein [Pseudolabrys sp.]